MEMIDRYLQAVRFWLPKKQQDDIIAELSEDLRAQLEERESALGRKLTEADVEALLRKRGSPILVAGGYLPQRSLIGPLLFPLYLFVLKIVTACVVGAVGLSWIVAIATLAFSSVSSHHHLAYAGVSWGSLWTAWFSSAAMVTLLFAILERTQARTRILESWNPRKLPPLRHPHLIPRSSSAIELAVNLCVVVWWGLNMPSPLTLHFGSLSVVLSAAWAWFFWGILLLTLGSAGLSLANLLRPWWTVGRTATRIALDLAGGLFFCWLMKAQIVVAIHWPGALPEHTAAVVSGVNTWLDRMFPVAVAITVIILATNIYRMIRLRRKQPAQPMHPAAV